jgi:ribosomal protein uL13
MSTNILLTSSSFYALQFTILPISNHGSQKAHPNWLLWYLMHGCLWSMLVTKELLAGQEIILICCKEMMIISGSLVRNQTKYAQFRAKPMNTNHGRSPFHFKSPARIVWRTIRGMVHQKTARGQAAIGCLSTFYLLRVGHDTKHSWMHALASSRFHIRR